MKKDYNVIWIDDEWEKQQEFKDECEDLGIHLQGFSYQKAGMDELDKHPNSWDAVILDGEIKDKSEHEEPSTKGLLNALMHLASLPANRQIPHFISTGKDKVKDNEMLKDEIIYIKDIDDEKLFDDIRTTIDKIEEFKVKILYKEVIEFLKRINKETSDSIIAIFKKMHFPESNEQFDSKLYYNQIRQALECIFIEAKEKGVIPVECFNGERPNIDQCYRYLVGDPAYHAGVRFGQPGERIVPEYIENMMSIIKNLGNEFSHPNENTKTHFLLFSLAFHLYEIAVWMYKYFEDNPDIEKNKSKCVMIEIAKSGDTAEKLNEIGIIEVHDNIFHIGNKYSLTPAIANQNGGVGAKVEIIGFCENTNEKTKVLYPYFAFNIKQIKEGNGSK